MMPLLSWLCATTAASSTSGSATWALFNATGNAPAWAQAQTTSTTAFAQPLGLSNQTTASAAITAYSAAANSNTLIDATGMGCIRNFWVDTGSNTIIWEDCVDQQQYMALAQQRVGRTENMRRDLAERQQEREAICRQTIEAQRLAHDQMHRSTFCGLSTPFAALARSRELLLSHLTEEQRETFEKNHWFVVEGGHSKKTYRIRTTGYTGNIEEMRNGYVTHRLCGHLRGALPLHDHHIAQKISLEYDEQAFLRVCHRHAA